MLGLQPLEQKLLSSTKTTPRRNRCLKRHVFRSNQAPLRPSQTNPDLRISHVNWHGFLDLCWFYTIALGFDRSSI